MAERKRIGLILPSANNVLEPDFYQLAPPNVTIHTARMWITDAEPSSLERMNQEVENCARYLATAHVDVMAYGCTSGSFLGGPGHDQRLLQRISEAGGVPAVATSAAAVEALRMLGLKRLSVASPYIDELNEKLNVFFIGSAFEILNVVGQQLGEVLDIGEQTPETIYGFSTKAFRPEADGMFLSCTDWRALEIVDRLEKNLGKPVVTANQATIWAAFRALGITEPIKGYGRLMESLTPMNV